MKRCEGFLYTQEGRELNDLFNKFVVDPTNIELKKQISNKINLIDYTLAEIRYADCDDGR